MHRVDRCGFPGSLSNIGYQSRDEGLLYRISPQSLRGHLSFIASDLLEGRKHAIAGLDIAAEYIAAQFRRTGLEPAGDDAYFQTANWVYAERDKSAFTMSIEPMGKSQRLRPAR